MPESEARIATNTASRLLSDLAQGFIHTYPVRYDAMTAEIAFPGGELFLTADGDSLSLRLAGPDKDAFETTKAMIAERLGRAAAHDTGAGCSWHDVP